MEIVDILGLCCQPAATARGSKADELGEVESSRLHACIAFPVDGTADEIDLSTKNTAKMRQDFGRYIADVRHQVDGVRAG